METRDGGSVKQEILPMALEEQTIRADDFIVSLCNVDAYNAVTNQKLWPNNRLLILGEARSGKTHIARIWSKKVAAQVFNEQFEQLYNDAHHSAVLAEDIDLLASEDELFHLINYCSQEGIALLMTARSMPSSALRDLKSRLNATHKILIKAPDDELLKILLYKYFSTNQIKVDLEVFEYISTRIERSFEAIEELAKLLNLMSLEQKRAITIPFVRDVLEKRRHFVQYS